MDFAYFADPSFDFDFDIFLNDSWASGSDELPTAATPLTVNNIEDEPPITATTATKRKAVSDTDGANELGHGPEARMIKWPRLVDDTTSDQKQQDFHDILSGDSTLSDTDIEDTEDIQVPPVGHAPLCEVVTLRQINPSKVRYESEDRGGAATKRKAVSDTDEANELGHGPEARSIKRPRLMDEPRAAIAAATTLRLLSVGTGYVNELGHGPEARLIKRPRLMDEPRAAIAIATGAQHVVALTDQGGLFSWGNNDTGALGRATPETDGDEVSASTPTAIQFPKGTKITMVVATDGGSFALTDKGTVYGWGAFLDNNGKCRFNATKGACGFSTIVEKQLTPVRISRLSNIVSLAAGNNHVLALTGDGDVMAFGESQLGQQGRRLVERSHTRGLRLVPEKVKLPRGIKAVYAGGNHSFCLAKDGKVWAWGLNQYGQCGIPVGRIACSPKIVQSLTWRLNEMAPVALDQDTIVRFPTVVQSLAEYDIVHIACGEHHTIAVTATGQLLVWGRGDSFQLGVDLNTLPDVTFSTGGEVNIARSITRPTILPLNTKFSTAACGSFHTLAVSVDGEAWTWGAGSEYQTGHGPYVIEDMEVPTKICEADEGLVKAPTKICNRAMMKIRVVAVAAGASFSVFGGVVRE